MVLQVPFLESFIKNYQGGNIETKAKKTGEVSFKKIWQNSAHKS